MFKLIVTIRHEFPLVSGRRYETVRRSRYRVPVGVREPRRGAFVINADQMRAEMDAVIPLVNQETKVNRRLFL